MRLSRVWKYILYSYGYDTVYQRFGVTCCFHHQGKKLLRLKIPKTRIWKLILFSILIDSGCCSSIPRFLNSNGRACPMFSTWTVGRSFLFPQQTRPRLQKSTNILQSLDRRENIYSEKGSISCGETSHSFNSKEFVCCFGSSQMYVKKGGGEMIDAVISELKE